MNITAIRSRCSSEYDAEDDTYRHGDDDDVMIIMTNTGYSHEATIISFNTIMMMMKSFSS